MEILSNLFELPAYETAIVLESRNGQKYDLIFEIEEGKVAIKLYYYIFTKNSSQYCEVCLSAIPQSQLAFIANQNQVKTQYFLDLMQFRVDLVKDAGVMFDQINAAVRLTNKIIK